MNINSASGKEITQKTVAVVRFGPETDLSGLTPAQYFQVTIDPDMVSPSGDFIRFGKHPGDEILGWQKVSALTILEVLGEWDGNEPPTMTLGSSGVTMLAKD